MHGFSVPLVLMMMGTSMVFMTAVFNLNITSRSAELRPYLNAQFRSLIGQISSILSTEPSCRLALGGPLTRGGAILPITQTFTQKIGVEIPIHIFFPRAVGQTTNALFLIANGDPVPSAVQSLPAPVRYGDLLITKLALKNLYLIGKRQIGSSKILRTQFAQMVVQAEASRPGLAGLNRYESDELRLSIILNNDDNKIYSCISLVFGTPGTNSYANPVPMPICGPLQFLYPDAATSTLRCVTLACPPGSSPIGSQPTGDVICK